MGFTDFGLNLEFQRLAHYGLGAMDAVGAIILLWAVMTIKFHVAYRIGFTFIAIGLIAQVTSSIYFLSPYEMPIEVSMLWALKDFGLVVVIVARAIFKIHLRKDNGCGGICRFR